MTNPSGSDTIAAPEIAAWLLAHLAAVTAADPRHIDLQEPFSRLGLGSLQATRMLAELADRLGRPLSPTLVWAYPTPAALAAYLGGAAPPQAHHLTQAARPPAAQDEPIAVVGLGCRFPGGADDPASFWRLLLDGVDAVREVPRDRWNADAFHAEDPTLPGKTNVRRGGFLERVDGFDPLFFGISPREAVAMDPQQRLALELAWEALEDAGIPPRGLAGSDTGVFVGAMWSDYAALMHRAGVRDISEYTATGTSDSILANRLSYWLGLQGPSLALDTACSSALVAVHLACQSLRSGEATLALAGGVHLMLAPDNTIAMSRLRALSPDGTLRAFDAAANGYVRGEGGGLVVLKPLSRAQADGDRIYCVIRGSATNNDGASNGLTAPNPAAQEAVLRAAYRRAGVDPASVHYVEAHGTGTPLGDPIEVRALGAVLGHGRPDEEPLRIGSVKTNIGHLEPAAGIASLIKLALAIHHRVLPSTLHFSTPNPRIPCDELHVRVQDRAEPWPRPREPPLAGVSAFGFGGTNCHVVVAGASPAQARLFVLAAASESALRDAARACRGRVAAPWFAPQPDTHLQVLDGHPTAPWRLAITAHAPEDLRTRLDAFDAGASRPGLASGRAPQRPPRPVFVFSGAGCDWPGMGRGLLHSVPEFRATLEACDRVIRELNGWSLIEALVDADGPRPDSALELQFVGIVAVEIALAAVWRAWGIEPAAVVGHSIGEIAAACVAGCLTLAEAMTTICHYGRLIAPLTGKGATAVVGMPAAAVAERIAADGLEMAVIAVDSPTSTVLSGEPSAVQSLLAALDTEGIFARHVRLELASHSPLMDPLLPAYREALQRHRPRPGECLLVSTVTGAPAAGGSLGADHWARNMREPVRFAAAVGQLLARGFDTFLEVSPHPVLQRALAQCFSHAGVAAIALPSLHRQTDERTSLLDTLGALHVRGCALPPADPRRLEILPLSAHTLPALLAQARRWADLLGREVSAHGLRDICHTAQLRRTHQAHRLALVGDNAAELADQLRAVRETGRAPALTHPPRLVFVFPGYGAQWLGMGRALAANEPVFRRALDACAAALSPWIDFSILDELRADAEHSRLGEADVVQPLTFALQVALAALLRHWGLHPSAVVGHSMGEIAAAHVAGALSLEHAAKVIVARSRIVREHASHRGGMLMLSATADEATSIVSDFAGRVVLGARNAPRMQVLSGELSALDEIAGHLQARGMFCRRVNIDYASHSPQMDPLTPLLRAAIADITPRRAQPRFCSTVTGDYVDGTTLDARYWGRNLRDPVLFAPAIARLSDDHDIFIEISTHPLFVTAIEETLRERDTAGQVVSLLRRDEDESFHLRRAVARLHERGCTIDWAALSPAGGRPVPLPTQAWQRERYWIDVAPPEDTDTHTDPEPSEFAALIHRVRWEPAQPGDPLTPRATTWILLVDRSPLGERLRDHLEARGERCLLVRAGQGFTDLGPRGLEIDPTSVPDLERTLDLARSAAPAAALHVVHLWSLDIAPLDALDQTAQTTMQALGCVSALHLAQALTRAGTPARVSLVTQGAQALGDDAPACAAGQVPLLGMGRVLAYDFPTLPCRRIDLAHGSAAAQVEALLAELALDDTEDEIALRSGTRLAPRLIVADPRDPAARRDGPEAPVLHADATYLITGGLGGLGLRAAQWLVHHGARHLLLLGRSAPNQDARRAIAMMEAIGVQVVVVSADVADYEQLSATLTEARRALPPLRGVLHAAGTMTMSPSARLDREHLLTCWAPKIQGTLNLARLLAADDLDLFALYSSALALIGQPGMAGYAAANTFLDGFAQHMRRQGRRALSVAWGAWAGSGMAVGEGPGGSIARRLELQGLPLMPPDTALRALGRILALDEANVAVMRLDTARWRTFHEGAARLSMLRGQQHQSASGALAASAPGPALDASPRAARLTRDRLLSLPPDERRPRLEALVQNELIEALRLPEGLVDRSTPFSRFGLDSIMAAELRRRLESALDQRITSTAIAANPSVAELGAALLATLEPTTDAPSPVPVRVSWGQDVLLEEKGIAYSLLTDDDVDGATAVLCEAFPREPMTRACGITAELFAPFARACCVQAAADGLSLVARHRATGQIVGCQISEDLAHPPDLDMSAVSPRFGPIFALLGGLDEAYRNMRSFRSGEVFHVNMAAILTAHEGGLILPRLFELSLDLARQRGFRRALGHCAAAVIQRLALDFDFREVARADYSTFEFEGNRVFQDIQDPPATILMERPLRTALAFEELTVGLGAEHTKTVTDDDVRTFAALSGDDNALHLSASFAATTIFGRRVAHGMLVASFVSTVIARQFPGEGAVLIRNDCTFKAPVYIGDTVTTRLAVAALHHEQRHATLRVECLVDGSVVLAGEATVMVPRRA